LEQNTFFVAQIANLRRDLRVRFRIWASYRITDFAEKNDLAEPNGFKKSQI